MKCQILFPRKNKKNISKCRLLKYLPSMQSVKQTTFEQQRQKRYLCTSVPSKDSDQPALLCSLIRIFTGCILDSQGCKVSSFAQ